MKNKQKISQLVSAAFFISIEVVLFLTPLGYVHIGPISATTMHLPVILSGIIFGPSMGALMGFVFGMISFLRATFSPNLTSFLFSPFIEVGGIHGNFFSLVIAFGPRILLGWGSAKLFRLLSSKKDKVYISGAITALLMTILHTALVMSAIWILFGAEYANAMHISTEGLAAAILGVITSNGVMEAIVATMVVPILVKALIPSVKRMGLYHEK